MVQGIIQWMKFSSLEMSTFKKRRRSIETPESSARDRQDSVTPPQLDGIYQCTHPCKQDLAKATEIITMANCVIRSGRIRDALSIYAGAYCMGKVYAEHLQFLVQSLCEKAAILSSQRPSDLAVCPLCQGILVEPLTLPCGHTYCKKCLLKTENVEMECLKCRAKYNPVQISNIKANIVVNSVLEKMWSIEVGCATLRLEGNALYLENKLEEAVTKYTQAQTLDPRDHLTHNGLSEAFLAKGNYQEALDHAMQASVLCPTSSKSYYHKGSALEKLGRYEDAVVAYLLYLVLEHSDHSQKKNVQENPQHVRWSYAKSKLERIHDNLQKELETLKGSCNHLIEKPGEIEKVEKKDFECSLCIRLFWQPVSTPCGHVFCKQCLQRSLDHKPRCPLCKNSLQEYLAERRDATTEFIELAMKEFFPVECQERQKAFEEEIKELASAGRDPEHGVPLFVCTMAYPSIPCPLHIYEPRYRLMTRQCMESGTREFGMCAAQDNETDGIAKCGTMLVMRDMTFYPDGRSVVDAVGSRRFKVLQTSMRDGYHVGSVQFISDVPIPEPEIQEVKDLHNRVYSEVSEWFSTIPDITRSRILQHFGPIPDVEERYLDTSNGPSWIWWTLAILPVDVEVQIRILAIDSLKRRLKALQRVLLFVARFGPQGVTQ